MIQAEAFSTLSDKENSTLFPHIRCEKTSDLKCQKFVNKTLIIADLISHSIEGEYEHWWHLNTEGVG